MKCEENKIKGGRNMPVIYMLNKQNSLMKEPYLSFDRKFKMISEELNGTEIELSIGSGKPGQFLNGFYNCDYAYQRNMMMKFSFVNINPEQIDLNGAKESTFVRCTYSFEYNESDMLDCHLNRLKAYSLRTDYYYIPKAEYLEFSFKVDSEINIYMDAIVVEKQDVQQVCHSMINQFISIFSLDD